MSEPKRRGRPPLVEHDRTISVSVALPSKQFDDLCRRALRDGVSVPEVIRREIRRADSRADDDAE